MPSMRPQLNVRVSENDQVRLFRLIERMSAELGMPVSQSDVVLAGLTLLERKYPSAEKPAEKPAEKKSRKKA